MFSQEARFLTFDTQYNREVPEGEQLMPIGFSGTEAISQLYSFRVELISKTRTVPFAKLIGQKATFNVMLADEFRRRHFHGIVSSFKQLPGAGRVGRYEAVIVPFPWVLTRTADCRIFQMKSVPAIVEEILTASGYQDFEWRLQGQHSPREYCVQYRESAFDFISRLLEEEGIFYFFAHSDSKHTMIMADHKAAYKPCPEQSTIRFHAEEHGGTDQTDEMISDWHHQEELRPGKFSLTDYFFETPSTKLEVNQETTIKMGDNDKLEVFDYPGEYAKKSEGNSIVALRIEEDEMQQRIYMGSSNVRSLLAGHKFTLIEHELGAENDAYVVTSVTHSGSAADYYSGGAMAGYTNSFTCIPASVPYRPPRVTPRPIVEGTQTAVVTGPKGEEIYSDKYGRVKVHFHWDRYNQLDENSSCWIRVSQPWAGKNWGGVWIPRIGQEVIVDFLEGNPDCPIITGRVYNAEQMPPYELPGNQTISGFKSRSSKGGTTSHYNELRFEDKKGDEQVIFHAEKNMDHSVENDSREHIGHDRSLTVMHDQKEYVKVDKHQEIEGNFTEKIWGDSKELIQGNHHHIIQGSHYDQVAGDQHLTLSGNRQSQTGGNETVVVGGNQDFVIGGNETVQTGGSYNRQTGGSRLEKVGGDLSLTVGGSRHLKVGSLNAVQAGQEIHLKGGMKVIIEAGMQLTIKAAGGFVDIGPAGVTIQGTMVLINSGGSAGSGSGASPSSPPAAKQASPTAPEEADPKKPDGCQSGGI
ncbi:MAG: type VI secretion system tip protein VgrG [Acidobacteria bacterium]|nr:type VI secretion system tip protein VgrG [Acidobacteriota bacterium]